MVRLRRDINKEIRNDSIGIELIPRPWLQGGVYRVYSGMNGEVIGYQDKLARDKLQDAPLTDCKLPREFFSHELLSVDISKEGSIYGFLNKWGLLYSPVRWLKPSEPSAPVIETETYIQDNHISGYISIAEVTEAFAMIQEMVTSFLDRVKAKQGQVEPGDWLDFSPDILDACSTTEECVSVTGPSGVYAFGAQIALTNAICNQMRSVIKDPAPWYICKGCGKPFKYQRGASDFPRAIAEYCDKSEAARIRKREQRGGPIKHYPNG